MTPMPRHAKMSRAAAACVAVVAALGAIYSYRSMYDKAADEFGAYFAVGFPILVDATVLAASLYYLGTCRRGRPVAGWRLLAHAGIFASIALNALAAGSWSSAPWHIVAPAVWGIIVELRSRELLGDYQAITGTVRLDRIPRRLWLTAPVPIFLDWLWMARAGLTAHTAARAARGRYLAACAALRITIPGWRTEPRRARALVRRQLRTGALDPAVLITATGLDTTTVVSGPKAVVRATLLAALRAGAPAPSPTLVPVVTAAPEGTPEGAPRPDAEGKPDDEPALIPKGRDASLADIVADLQKWVVALGRKPTSREVKARYEIGDTRARDALRALDEGSGPHLAIAGGG